MPNTVVDEHISPLHHHLTNLPSLDPLNINLNHSGDTNTQVIEQKIIYNKIQKDLNKKKYLFHFKKSYTAVSASDDAIFSS